MYLRICISRAGNKLHEVNARPAMQWVATIFTCPITWASVKNWTLVLKLIIIKDLNKLLLCRVYCMIKFFEFTSNFVHSFFIWVCFKLVITQCNVVKINIFVLINSLRMRKGKLILKSCFKKTYLICNKITKSKNNFPTCIQQKN